MIQDLHRVIRLIENDWRNARVLVVGDVMLDRYIWGNVERISPEAPVPIVHASHRNERPGGAANVAMNIAGLGAKAVLFGLAGQDPDCIQLQDLLRDAGVESQLTQVPSHPTIAKLRILSGRQQMLRLDTEQVAGYPREAYDSLIAKAEKAMANADSVVLSDYAKGCLTEDICQRVIQAANRRGIPVLVDPKHRDFSRYRGATTICPNLQELSAVLGIPPGETDALLAAGQKLVPQLQLSYLTATLSEKGIAVLREESRWIAPALARQVFDVSGAGDTVIATLAVMLAHGADWPEAIHVANVAAGIVVGKLGTAVVTRAELDAALN